jgi:hypothetical protein
MNPSKRNRSHWTPTAETLLRWGGNTATSYALVQRGPAAVGDSAPARVCWLAVDHAATVTVDHAVNDLNVATT